MVNMLAKDLAPFERYLATCYDLRPFESAPVLCALRIALQNRGKVREKYLSGAKVLVFPARSVRKHINDEEPTDAQ